MGAPLVRRKFLNIKLLLVRKQRHPRTLNECSISEVKLLNIELLLVRKQRHPRWTSIDDRIEMSRGVDVSQRFHQRCQMHLYDMRVRKLSWAIFAVKQVRTWEVVS